MKHTLLTVIMLFTCFAVFKTMAQQAEVQRVKISAARAWLHLTQEPTGFTSALTPDKKKITLLLKNTSVSDAAKATQGSGMIENIYIQQRAKNLEISILLKEKLGYTAVPLPFSKSILVEVFDWETVRGADDDYRSGLLALETSAETALKFFIKAASAGHADASAHAGMIFLKEGKTDEARTYLLKSTAGNTTVADAFAAMAQVYAAEGKADESAGMLRIFLQRTGAQAASDTLTEPVSLATDTFIDSLHVTPDSALSMNSAVDSTLATEKSAMDTVLLKNSNEPQPTSWMTKIILSSVVIIGGVLAVMGWLYLRWRKQFKNPPAIAENLPLKSQSQTPPPAANGTSPGLYSHAAKVYGQIGDEPTQKSFKKEDEEVKPFKTGESSNAVEADNEFFKTVRQEPDWQELLKEEPQRARSQADETAEYSSPGSVELAKSILRQQQKQKAEALKSLHSGDIKQDANKLSQQAKILGLEQGSLEVKKNFSDLEADEKRLAELKRKFSND